MNGDEKLPTTATGVYFILSFKLTGESIVTAESREPVYPASAFGEGEQTTSKVRFSSAPRVTPVLVEDNNHAANIFGILVPELHIEVTN